MGDKPRALEAMSCEELLREMSRLTPERDHLQAQVGMPGTATVEELPQVNDIA